MSAGQTLRSREFHLPRLRPARRQRNEIFRLMAGMLRRGYPLPDILTSLADHSSRFRGPLRRMSARAEEGVPLGRALEKEWRLCPKIVTELARLGDRRGVLPETFTLACELIDPDYPREFAQPIKTILWYLAMLITVTVIATFVVMTYVMPTFFQMFAGGGSALPSLTVITLTAYQILTQHTVLFLLGFIAAAALCLLAYFRARGTMAVEKVPLLGRLLSYHRWWKVCFGAGTLMKAGIPLDEALATLGSGLGLPTLVDAAERIRARLAAGKTPAEAVAAETALSPAFRFGVERGLARNDLAAGLVAVGEMERELYSSLVSRLLPVIEVAVIIAIITVGCLMVASIYYPLFILAEAVS